jgi:hypothetical protein
MGWQGVFVDKSKRESVTRSIFDTIASQAEVQQRQVVDHLDTAEYLEAHYRLDLRAFTTLYGDEILDGTVQELRELLDIWKRLYESLDREDSVTVLSIERTAEDTYRRMSPIKKQLTPETFREGIMVMGKGTILFNPWMNEEDPLLSAKIIGGELYRFDEQEVRRVREFTLATTDGPCSYSSRRVSMTLMSPQADILELVMTELEGGQIEIQKGPLVRSYPTALYRILKDYQATA